MMRHSNATLGIRLLLLIIIASFLVGCQQVDRKYDKAYFDFDSLVNIQVKKISLTGDSIHKAANMDGKADESVFLADSSALAHELDVFRQLDVINKPLYKEAYKITSEKDAKSNLSVRNYTSSIKSPVSFVRFYYQNDFRRLKKIESSYKELNSLYFTQRQLILEFDDTSGEPLLMNYSISGSQKMILNDSVKFLVQGKISF